MDQIEKDILKRIFEYENQKREALSRRYPFLKKPIIYLRCTWRNAENFFDRRIKYTKRNKYFEFVAARHKSVLRRKLGDSDPELQEQKIINLRQAVKRLDGIIIKPNDIFSFWQIVGRPRYEDGYVDGMLLANGRVVRGLGGGLCQLSNFLYWIFLHAPMETIERHHHSLDVFPDSGRVLPFGGGATIFYNYLDLKLKNVSPYPLQLKIWLTEDHLKGQILCSQAIPEKYHLLEKNHLFIKKGQKYFRYNEIYRETFVSGKKQKTEKIISNFAPVLYEVTDEYLQKNNFEVFEVT